MSAPRSPARRVLAALTANIPYKILSVLIAVALWFIVRDERVETQAIWQLELQIPPELAISNEVLPELTVGVAGTRVSLDRLRHETLVHTVKLKSGEPGLLTLHVRPEDLSVPAGVEVVHVAPSTVSVRLEPRVTRRVPVRPRIVLDDDSPLRVKRSAVAPDLVRIQGPASVVAAVDQLWTDAIPVPRGAETLSQTVSLNLPHPQLKLLDVSSVAVTVDLEPISAATATASPSPDPSPAKKH
ncbi:MAG TPA: CdaR family protein [bacterium]|nr:CdaR family protein [bacterium]